MAKRKRDSDHDDLADVGGPEPEPVLDVEDDGDEPEPKGWTPPAGRSEAVEVLRQTRSGIAPGSAEDMRGGRYWLKVAMSRLEG